MNNKWTKNVSAFIFGWFIGLLIWRLIVGVDEISYLAKLGISSQVEVTVIAVSIAILAGSIFGTLQFLYEKFIIRSISFRRYVIHTITTHIVIMIGIYFLAYSILSITGSIHNQTFYKLFTSPILLANLIYSILINSVIIFFIQINRLLGKGNLKKLVMGKFYAPKEELRAFMFLDLKSSTTIAEQLGHLKYSRFIQDCFHYLSVVDAHNAHIYQYVGDEVVLTWEIGEDDTLDGCIHAFYAYDAILKDQKHYFQTEYGVQPIFKAGLHLGPVTVVEVGNIKREIAYHGDTINVASRIQEQCKNFDRLLLISEEAYKRVKHINGYTFKNVGEFVLRGRKNSTQLYDVMVQEA